LSFSGVAGGQNPAAKSVDAGNAGGGTIAGVNIVSTTYGGSEPAWLDATVSGTTINVVASPAKLAAGTYTAAVVVGSATGGNATFTVTFTVAPQPPILRLSPTSLTFSGVSNGQTPARQNVSIVNGGGGTLTGLDVSTITYSGSPNSQWVDARLSGTTISVGATPAKLLPGNYSATILIVSSNGGNATLTVTIAVAAPPPSLGLDPNALTFGALFNSSLPGGQAVRAVNLSGGAVSDLGVLSVGGNTSQWLRVNIDGTTIVVTPTSTTVGRGTITGVVTIVSSRGGSATIAITYNISFIG
jgi:hypothetical protein